jgi:NADH-quinone oxidoreductase subunit L
MAFVATIFATICLSGIPPFTAYWVKSAMDEVIHEVGWIPLCMLVVTSVIYSAFLAKFLSLNFIKGMRPKHLHLHGETLMPIAYTIMVSMLAVLLYEILCDIEPIAGGFVEKGFERSSLAVGLAVLISYVIALKIPRYDTPVGRFLGDRMYLPALNDLILPKIGWAIVRLVD